MTLDRSKYQIFPSLSHAGREAHNASITQHGVEHPTTWDDHGNLLDGWERMNIAAELGIDCPRLVRQCLSEAEKFQFILAVNAHRRPCLSTEQKRLVIDAYLRGDPEIADNALADALGVSKNTVLDVRRRLEESRRTSPRSRSCGRLERGRASGR